LGACFRLQAEHFILYFLLCQHLYTMIYGMIWSYLWTLWLKIWFLLYCQREQLWTNWVHAMWRLPLQFQRSLRPLSPIHMRYREFQSALLENDCMETVIIVAIHQE
jgi:hypothetical protein